MTRKDFEAIAKVIKDERTMMRDQGQSDVPVISVQAGIAAVFARSNPRFDSAIFRDACRPDPRN